MGAAVVMEGLESRRLLTGSHTAFQPDLEGQLSILHSVIGVPGQKLNYKLAVFNEGARLNPTRIGIGFFINSSPSLTDATLFAGRMVPITLRVGRHNILHGSFNLPDASTTPVGTVYIMAVINMDLAQLNGMDNYVVPEAPGTSGVTLSGVFNPSGNYDGTFTSDVTHSTGTLNLTVGSTNGKITTNVQTSGGEFGNLQADDLASTLTNKGVFSLNSIGSDPADNISHYVLKLHGTYNQRNQDIENATYSISGVRNNAPFSDHGTFTVTAQ